ncbi:hypothetical protein [Capnocytophaga sp. oral taxon 878]|uniref:hypothetical protein n=1 Tax=Capnocytophaga sp. oral taxon 878 TaxID=1316596 RepID=UPI000D035451|nr:hypothetical protein [Capnocytophaga sp. oral taxon 878]AVM50510.1 hypothetical protein C4H12_08450 [Capnocytophaga sp. oral taxon 878]
MPIHSIKETFVEVPTKANSALNSQLSYYKLVLFRFIAKSSYGLISFFVYGFASLLILFFLSLAAAYAIGEALGSNGLGFAIVGAFYIVLSLVVLLFRKKLIERSLLRKLSEIYFKTDPEDEEENEQ